METPGPREYRKSGEGRLTLRLAGMIAAVAVIAGLIWFAGSRLRDLDQQLKVSEQRAEAVNRRLLEYSRELEQALERAKAARQQTSEAQQQAEESEAARLEAESQKEEALRQAERARSQTDETREELERVREKREQELDRMQRVLNKIAPTRRTPSGMVMMLSDEAFRFDFDKATLRPENRETLSRIAGILLASEGYRLFVDGHTDDIGTDEYNQGLSERRAQSVRAYLVDAGIPAEAIAVQGFGKSQPLIRETTRTARAENRRVEIGIVDTIIHYEEQVRY